MKNRSDKSYALSEEQTKQLYLWRQRAQHIVQAIADKDEQQKTANKYYTADQAANAGGVFKYPWPQMEKYLESESEIERRKRQKKQRDLLLIRNPAMCIYPQNRYYEPWKPTLEEYRKKYPIKDEEK